MNLTDSKYNRFALVREMLQTADIIRDFDFGRTAGVAKMIKEKGRLFLTGEGSSRIFPAKSFMYGVMKRGLPISTATEGSFQAAEYNLADWAVAAASNSGQTKEVIALMKKLGDAGHRSRFGITAREGTKLGELTDECFVLSCGSEEAVAATKSVVEQALVYHSILCNLIDCQCPQNKGKAADLAQEVMQVEYDPTVIEKLAAAKLLYFAGRNTGVAEELTLKTNEITRKKSDYLEGTYLLHGVEEVMSAGDACILIDPFPSEYGKIKEFIEGRAQLTVIAIASEETPFPTIKFPQLAGYELFFQLMAGWNLLVQIGVALGIDLDKPERARKVGNQFEG
ncbi:MAG: SIS domain-containing protein [Thermoguttaceae bacterium]|jgi:glucosamine--fructose-6-phosphate aminotransferase (isomerizing)